MIPRARRVAGVAFLLAVMWPSVASALRASGADPLPLLGIAVTVFVCVTIVAGATVRVTKDRDWRRIAVRVAGSWITAISLLMIGWAMKTGG